VLWRTEDLPHTGTQYIHYFQYVTQNMSHKMYRCVKFISGTLCWLLTHIKTKR